MLHIELHVTIIQLYLIIRDLFYSLVYLLLYCLLSMVIVVVVVVVVFHFVCVSTLSVHWYGE